MWMEFIPLRDPRPGDAIDAATYTQLLGRQRALVEKIELDHATIDHWNRVNPNERPIVKDARLAKYARDFREWEKATGKVCEGGG